MCENEPHSAELAEYTAQLTHEVHRAIEGRERLIDDDLKTALQQPQTCSLFTLLIFRFNRLGENSGLHGFADEFERCSAYCARYRKMGYCDGEVAQLTFSMP